MMLLFMSVLNLIRHGYYFIQAFYTSTAEIPVKYKITNRALLILGISVAYILTVVFTGIKL